MGDHDNISLDAYDSTGPPHVRVDDLLTDKAILDFWQVLGAENRWLKLVRLWVIEILQVCDCLLFLVLDI